MNKQLVELIFGAALHDIGKVIQRSTNQKIKHAQLGADFLKTYPQLKGIDHHIRYHHADKLRQRQLDKNSTAYITYIADNIASGVDRRDTHPNEERIPQWDTHTNQEDIFNRIYEEEVNKRYYAPVMLDDRKEINKAQPYSRKFNPGDYQAIVGKYKEHLPALEVEQSYINSLLGLLEATLSYVPSSTNKAEAVDISLYDHSKLTAALANAIYLYLSAEKVEDYHQTLYLKASDFYEQEVFRLLSIDISGIQTFIYRIRDQRAARMLRSRSFYLEIFLENLLDELLEILSLSRANVLYSGGGNAYLIIPNTAEAIAQVEQTQIKINQFLQEKFGNELFVAMGSTAFTANDAIGENSSFGKVYQRVGRQLSENKLHRYTAEDIIRLNELGKKIGRECTICQRIEEEAASEICSVCDGLIQFSPQLQTKEFILINEEPSQLPLGFNRYLHAINREDLARSNDVHRRTYSKNKFYFGKNQSIHLWVGEYMDSREDGKERFFEEYANLKDGINRLGVVRADVDDLGQAFITGFSNHYNTLSRSATFSRTLSLFFKFHINQILKELDVLGTIIYSGGDDVFILGHWFDMIQFSIRLREEFLEYSQGKITMSTGIGLYPSKTPVAIMALETGKLEEAAKDNGKDSISLFSPKYTFKWDDFIRNVWTDKFVLVQDFFEENQLNDAYGKTFAYNLLTLIRDSFEEVGDGERGDYKTISWARWAYYLGRLEPNDPKLKNSYREFTRKLHEYFASEKEVKELEVALELYVYTIRGLE